VAFAVPGEALMTPVDVPGRGGRSRARRDAAARLREPRGRGRLGARRRRTRLAKQTRRAHTKRGSGLQKGRGDSSLTQAFRVNRLYSTQGTRSRDLRRVSRPVRKVSKNGSKTAF
jgi:hypothetical protein